MRLSDSSGFFAVLGVWFRDFPGLSSTRASGFGLKFVRTTALRNLQAAGWCPLIECLCSDQDTELP